jgi:tetratricopeptide (TPR) repeat protein
MKPERAALLKITGLAVALGVAAWLLAPLLLPIRLPPDFPDVPDLKLLNASARELVQRTDQEARRRPGSAEAVGKLGMVYHANLLYAQAEAAYRIAARLAPEDHQWAYAQAVLKEENGAGKEQLKFLQKTIELEPDHVPALIVLADSSFKGDRLDEAARHYGTAARTPGGPGSLQAAFGLGRVAARRGEWNKVIETVAPATNSYPHAAPLYELLGEAYTALGQPDRAAQARQRGAGARWRTIPPLEDPFNEQLISVCYSSTRLLKQAGLLSRTGHPDRAIELARRAAQAEPADADVHNYLARTLITFYGDKSEAIDEAMTHLGECLRLRPSDPAPLGGFADDFFKAPKPPAAVERLQALLRSHSDIPGVHYFLGQAADALGKTEQAATEYRAALKANPNDSGAHNKLGLIAESSGKYDEASAHFQKAIQLNPMNTAARLNLAIDLMQRGKYGQGMKQLNEVLRINPHDAAAHFCMGFAFLSMKRPEEAAAKFRQGLLYRPDDAEARFGMGAALAAQGRREEAAAELRAALSLSPNHPRARQLLYQLGN